MAAGLGRRMICTCHYNSPLGGITLASDGTALTGLWFDGMPMSGTGGTASGGGEQEPAVFAEAIRWLDIYFSGRDPGFIPPLSLKGTPFRRAVWEILRGIPFGNTMTYGEIAGILAGQRGIPRMSAQAVGSALGHNPLLVIIPCHRVVGTGGRLAGYAGGPERKAWLLNLEGATGWSRRQPGGDSPGSASGN